MGSDSYSSLTSTNSRSSPHTNVCSQTFSFAHVASVVGCACRMSGATSAVPAAAAP